LLKLSSIKTPLNVFIKKHIELSFYINGNKKINLILINTSILTDPVKTYYPGSSEIFVLIIKKFNLYNI